MFQKSRFAPTSKFLQFSNKVEGLKAIYTIAATIIGAGILALPVYLGEAGFFPGTIMILLVGAAAIFSALFIAETLLRFNEAMHLPRLAQKLLGRPGLYLMFLGIIIYVYGAMTGYLSAGGQVIYEISQAKIPIQAGVIIYFILGTFIIYLGLRAVKSTSFILFSLMLFLFVGLISFTFLHLNFSLLGQANWSVMPMCFGILVFAFTGHTIIPSLAIAMRKNVTGLKRVCFWGVFLPLILYLLWFFILSSTVPYGDLNSGISGPLFSRTLAEAKVLGQPATIPLAHLIGGQILILAVFFTLFSTFTSFLGFGLSLKDSYIDISRKNLPASTCSPRFREREAGRLRRGGKEYLALVLTVLPPFFLALWHPFSFLKALEIAGLYGGGLFIGILPALMVLRARKLGERAPEFIAPGGSITPILVLLFFLFSLIYKTCLFF